MEQMGSVIGYFLLKCIMAVVVRFLPYRCMYTSMCFHFFSIVFYQRNRYFPTQFFIISTTDSAMRVFCSVKPSAYRHPLERIFNEWDFYLQKSRGAQNRC